MADEEEHANPFWREQEALLTGSDRKLSAFVEFIERAFTWRKRSPIVQEGNLNAVRQAERDLATYEAMIQEGRAELWGELDCNWEDFQIMRKTYERDTNKFDGYYFRAVPRYAEVAGPRKEYRFLQKAVVYKIKK